MSPATTEPLATLAVQIIGVSGWERRPGRFNTALAVRCTDEVAISVDNATAYLTPTAARLLAGILTAAAGIVEREQRAAD